MRTDILKDFCRYSGDQGARLQAVSDVLENEKTNIVFLGKNDFGKPFDGPVRLVCRVSNQRPIEVQTQQYIGALRDKDGTILIRSRFDGEGSFFTAYILSRTLGLRGAYFPRMSPQLALGQTSELLIAVAFVQQIKAARRRGLYRAYKDYERNDSAPKGRVDVSRHIRLNPIANGRAAYTVRERTVDNPVNQVIVAAWTVLEKKYDRLMRELANKNRTVKECMGQLRNSVRALSRQELSILLRQREKKINSPLYKDWETVRRTARQILRHMTPSAARSGDNETGGVLVDMNNLWEQYLESVLRKMDMPAAGCRLKAQYEYPVLFPTDGVKMGKRRFKPDFCWNLADGPREETVLLADAKYKESWSEIACRDGEHSGNEWGSEVREDVFQILSYMFTCGCSQGAVICPIRKSGNREIKVTHQKYTVRAGVCDATLHVFGLPIPQDSPNSDSAAFAREMEAAEKELCCRLKALFNGRRRTDPRVLRGSS